MYDYIKGTLSHLTISKATLDTAGLGFCILIPINTHAQLLSKVGEVVALFTSFVIREDSHRLFGFLERNERDLFEKLSDVTGIGPKTALSIIGHLTAKELDLAIYQQDISTLSRVPGIGKKTAERLIVELKDKIRHLKPLLEEGSCKDSFSDPHIQDALSALIHLGYNEALAQKAIKKVLKESNKTLTLSELITYSLKAVHTKL